MALVFTAMSTSVDGYLTGRNARPGAGLGDADQLFDWFGGGDHPSREYPAFHMNAVDAAIFDYAAARVGASVCGRKTYEDSERFGGGGPHPTAALFVVSHQEIPDAATGQTIVTGGLESAIDQAKAVADQEGKDVGLMGGVVTTEALAAGLLDEIIIWQRPVLLGSGQPLFRALPAAVQLECLGVAVSRGVTHLHYRVLR